MSEILKALSKDIPSKCLECSKETSAYLQEHDAKVRADAIDECIYIVNHYIGTEHIVDKLELLKEQKYE